MTSGKEVVGTEFRNVGQAIKKDFSSSFGERYTSTRDNVNDSILNYDRVRSNGVGRITPLKGIRQIFFSLYSKFIKEE